MNLIGRVFLHWRRTLQKKIHSTGCTLKQYYLLRRLIRSDFLRPTEIAEELYCDKPTASVVIRNLEKKGWISRQKDPKNGRSFLLMITEEGTRKQREVEQILNEVEDPFSSLSKVERRQLKDLLRKVEMTLPE